MKTEIALIAEAEAILDETLAYEASRVVHQLKRRLGIDIRQINVEVRPAPNDSGSYCAVCTVLAAVPGLPQESPIATAPPNADEKKRSV